MSWQAQRAVWAHSEAKGNTLLTLLAISDFLNQETHLAWPSVATLARRTRQTERNVRYALKSLRLSGEITIVDGAGPGGSNCYTINLPYEGRPDALPLQSLPPENFAGVKDSTQTPEKIAPNPFNPKVLTHDEDGEAEVRQLAFELWPRVLDRLRVRIPQRTFETWLSRTQVHHYERGHLVVSVPSPMAAEFLTARVMPFIEEAVASEVGESCTVAFHVA